MKHAPYSYSKISTFQQCPLKFKFQYIDRIPVDQEQSPAIERGLSAANRRAVSTAPTDTAAMPDGSCRGGTKTAMPL